MVLGDYNSDISDETSSFGRSLKNVSMEYNLVLSSMQHLPPDTYISDAWGSTSWLDHCIATHDGNDTFIYISDAWGSTSWLDHCIATHDGNDTFTYISDAWGSTSWLDHCIATHDGNNVINDISVCCNLATTNQ